MQKMLSWHSAPHSASSEVVASLSRLELSAATQLVSLAGQARPGLLTAPHFKLVVGNGDGGDVVFPPPATITVLNNDFCLRSGPTYINVVLLTESLL